MSMHRRGGSPDPRQMPWFTACWAVLGRFFGVDPTWLRIAFALGTLFTAVLPGFMVYAILTVLIPSDSQVKGQGID